MSLLDKIFGKKIIVEYNEEGFPVLKAHAIEEDTSSQTEAAEEERTVPEETGAEETAAESEDIPFRDLSAEEVYDDEISAEVSAEEETAEEETDTVEAAGEEAIEEGLSSTEEEIIETALADQMTEEAEEDTSEKEEASEEEEAEAEAAGTMASASELEDNRKDPYDLSGIEPAEVFRFFREIAAIPHGSYHTDAISDYLAAFARDHGYKYVQDEAGNVVIYADAAKGCEDAPILVLQGHMDMVCEKDPGVELDMDTQAITLMTDGEWLTADGTTLGGDNGIAVAYMLAILDDPSILHPALECIFTVDEEVGMLGAQALDGSLIRGRRMLNLDSEEEGILTAGCAGGTRQVIVLGGKRNERKGLVLDLKVSGLLGGHSGEMPGRGRANAIIILGRALFNLYQVHPFRLMRVNGGTKNNAIPREAQASLLFSGETDQKEISQAVRSLHETIHAEYQVTDPGLTISSSWQDTDPREKKTVFIKRDTRRILRFLMSVPDGLIEYMPGFDRMPQTSLNFGVLTTAADGIEATFLVRSALNSQREMMNDRLRCIAAQFDGKVDVKGSYPAWEYRFQSDFRDMLADLYEKITGKKALVCVTHGGLECGLLSDKLPGLDCVSIGPRMFGIHTPQEKLHLASTAAIWTYIKAVLTECAKQ